MNVQQFLTHRLKLGMLCIALISFFSFPDISYAEGSVFDCLEDEKECIEELDQGEEEAPVVEETDAEAEARETSPVGLTAWNYIQVILALLFVVGLLYAMLKFINRKSRLYDKNRMMKNLGGLSLGQQKSVQLIVVGETYYLIGVGEDIRLLKEITDEGEIATLLAYYEDVDEIPFQGPFEKLLLKFSPQKKNKPKQTDNEETDFSQLFNHRLTEIKKDRKKQLNRLAKKERDEDD